MVLRDFKIGALLLTVFITLSVGCQSQRAESERRNITVELSEGDIAFRRGYGVISSAVVTAARGTYSHCGVVIHYNGEWCVVHAVPYEGETLKDDRVYCEPIGEFFSTHKANCGAIYRLVELDTLQRSSVATYAKYHAEAETQFDHDYNLGDESKLYCSELVWRAYLGVNRDLSQGRRTHVVLPPFDGVHVMPADIEFNDSLTLVYSFVQE